MTAKVLPIVGFEAIRALNSFSTLMLGLKMIPEHLHKTYEEFLDEMHALDDDGLRKKIRLALHFVELDKDSVHALMGFATDANGIAYSASNIRTLSPDQAIEAMVEVCLVVARMKITIVTEEEKKRLKTSRLTSAKSISEIPRSRWRSWLTWPFFGRGKTQRKKKR